MTINCKSESAKKYPEGVENTYGIDHLKIAEATHVSDDYEWIIAQRMTGHMEDNINNDKSITHKCNVLSNILNTMKRFKKIGITHQYYRIVWTPVAEGK